MNGLFMKGYCRSFGCVLILSLGLTGLAMAFDLFDWIHVATRPYEGWKLDEILFAFPMAAAVSSAVVLFLQSRSLARLTRSQDSILARLFRYADEAIVLTDEHGHILQVNDAFFLQTGYDWDEVRGRSMNIIRSRRHDDAFFQAMWKELAANDRWSGEVWNRRKDGETYPQLLSIMAIKDGKGRTRQYLGILKDISLMKVEQETIRRMAYEDPLTGLPNRLLFEDRLQQACGHSGRRQDAFAVFFCDLNGFKGVNDVHGHFVGDQVLAESGRRIARALREDDTIARFGGDEFVALARDVDGWKQAVELGERIMAAFDPPISLESMDLLMSVSVGVALYPDCGRIPEDIVKAADQAMYRSKRHGGGVVRASCAQGE